MGSIGSIALGGIATASFAAGAVSTAAIGADVIALPWIADGAIDAESSAAGAIDAAANLAEYNLLESLRMKRFPNACRRRPAGPPGSGMLLIAFLLALAGCRGEPPVRWPFPRVEAGDDAAVLALLRERARAPENLYAELTMSFQGAGRSGVFDAVVRYVRPGRLRMTAFRDIIITSREVFDLSIDGERCELVIEAGGGGERKEFSGSVREMARVHPGFRAFAHLREGFFLPGALPGGEARRVGRSPGDWEAEDRGPGGEEVTWRLDPGTLGVRRAELRLPGEGAPIVLDYRSYREAAGRYFPERFELIDRGAGVRIEGVLREIEVDAPPEGEDRFAE